MRVFVDTSAFYALLDRDDANHNKAKKIWRDLLEADHTFVTGNYVLVETFALLQNRLGIGAVRGFHDDLLPLISVEYVSRELHRAGISSVLSTSRRSLSLVDCVSFEIMRSSGIKVVFTFDRHFAEQGFSARP